MELLLDQFSSPCPNLPSPNLHLHLRKKPWWCNRPGPVTCGLEEIGFGIGGGSGHRADGWSRHARAQYGSGAVGPEAIMGGITGAATGTDQIKKPRLLLVGSMILKLNPPWACTILRTCPN